MGLNASKNLLIDLSMARAKIQNKLFIKRAKEASKKESRKAIKDSLIYLFSILGSFITFTLIYSLAC